MPKSKYSDSRDKNESGIVDALEQRGATVIRMPRGAGFDLLILNSSVLAGEGCPDLETTLFPACANCEYNPCDFENNLDYCPAPERR